MFSCTFFHSVFVVTIILIFLFFVVTKNISSKPTGPPLISQQRKLAKSLSSIPSNFIKDFPYDDIRFAILVPDQKTPDDFTTTSTTTTPPPITASSTTSPSSTSATSGSTTTNTNETTSTSAPSSSTTSLPTTTPTQTWTTGIVTSTTISSSTKNNNSNIAKIDPPSFEFSDFYQIVLLTSSQIISYRVSQFLDPINRGANDFASSQLPLWRFGSSSERLVVDGKIFGDSFSSSLLRLRDPTAATLIFATTSDSYQQRFPFPEFRGILWTERSACVVRFMMFSDPHGGTTSWNDIHNAGNENDLRSAIKRVPFGIKTVAGTSCGTTQNSGIKGTSQVQFASPSGLSSMTSGGIVFVADDSCVKVLYNFDLFLGSKKNYLYNFSSSSNNYYLSVDVFAGQCGSGGSSDGNVVDFARFYQVEQVVFDAQESVLIVAQRFGFLRKIVPVPRSYADVVRMKQFAVSSTISSELTPGSINQMIWTGMSSSASPLSLSESASLFIVSAEHGSVETNATTSALISIAPQYLGIYSVPLFNSNNFRAKSLIILPNGSAIAFQPTVNDFQSPQVGPQYLLLTTSSASSSPSSPVLLFEQYSANHFYQGRPSHSGTLSDSLIPTPTHSKSQTISKSDSYPTKENSKSLTRLHSPSVRGTTESLSVSADRTRATRTQPTESGSNTAHFITPSLTDTVYFFRPSSVIPRESMLGYVVPLILTFGFVGAVSGAAPPNAMIGFRAVDAFDSCDCPTLSVTKIDSTLRYFEGLDFGVSDAFVLPVQTIDKHADVSTDFGKLFVKEKIVPRIRAIIIMHVGTAVVIAPPMLFGLRIVDGFIASEGMPAAFRIGLLCIVVSVWFEGALAASTALILLSPAPSIDGVVFVLPHLLFCLLLMVVVPTRLSSNALKVEPKPHLEEIVYDDLLSPEELAKQEEKKRRKEKQRLEKEEKQRFEDSRYFPADGETNPKKKQEETANDSNNNNNLSPTSSRRRARGIAVFYDQKIKRKISIFERFARWSKGSIHWQPPYSESFPRSFPLVHSLIGTSPTSFHGQLFMAHVFVSIGLGIVNGYRISRALRNPAFSVDCNWILEMSSALIVGVFAISLIVLQVKYTRSHGGAFIAPPTTIGHLSAVIFSAAAKILQVTCSFADKLWYVESDTFTPNADTFKSRLVSAADICVVITLVALFASCFPFFVKAAGVIGSKLKSCAVNLQAVAAQSHRLSVHKQRKDASSNNNNITNEDLAMHLTEKGELWTMLDKMERKRIPKPEHLDLLRRPLVNNNNSHAHHNGIDDDDDEEELTGIKTTTSMFVQQQNYNHNLHNKNRRNRHHHGDDDDEIAIEGASVHNNDAGKLDSMERYSTLLRTERIDEWKKHQRFLRAQSQAAIERKMRDEERKAEEDRLMKEFIEREMAAAEKEASQKFVLDLL